MSSDFHLIFICILIFILFSCSNFHLIFVYGGEGVSTQDFLRLPFSDDPSFSAFFRSRKCDVLGNNVLISKIIETNSLVTQSNINQDVMNRHFLLYYLVQIFNCDENVFCEFVS